MKPIMTFLCFYIYKEMPTNMTNVLLLLVVVVVVVVAGVAVVD